MCRGGQRPESVRSDAERDVLLQAVERGGFGVPPQRAARAACDASHFRFLLRARRGSVGRARHQRAAARDHPQGGSSRRRPAGQLSMLEAQMQGGIIDGLGGAFYGEVPIEKGRATSRNFGDYRMIRMREARWRSTRIHPEPPPADRIRRTAPAADWSGMANAIAALTGERIRVMPSSKRGCPG